MRKKGSYMRLVTAAVLGLAFMSTEARAEGYDSILLWMVNDDFSDPQIPDTGPTDLKFIDQLVSRPDGYNVNGARLRVAGTENYLNIYESGESSAYANALMPIAPDPTEGIFVSAGPVWSSFGSYGDAAYSFLVELGHWEDDKWTVMAVSAAVSYAELVQGGWTTDNINDYPRHGPWAPTFSVPEPTGGLLVMIGASLLALRRRQMTMDSNV